MANRFCPSCGAKLLSGANFCVECGEAQPGAPARRRLAGVSLQRYAPLFVVLSVLAVGGSAVVLGVRSPKTPPVVPRRDAPSDKAGSGDLPTGHPPLAIPEPVKQALRDMASKAAAAPDDIGVWKHLAEVQYRAAQLDPAYLADAQKAYEHVLEREPNNLDAIHQLGNIAFDQQKPEQAVDYYRRYLKQKPDDLEVQTDLGTMYLSSGKTDAALQQYEAVLKTNPSFFQAQFNMAIAYRTLGDAEKMRAALEKSRALAPDDKTRSQVEQLLAGAQGQPPAEVAAAPPQAPAAPAGTFQADVENVFRQSPILGPKVQRIQWQGPDSAQVFVRDFPMDQMPPEMRTMFFERMKGRIKEKKDTHQVSAVTKFELMDDATGKLMDTFTE